eukprot:TRINITY_DN4241_c0_g1_i1.p1 TRINITY_DN4241_c0_g1~~TRINITY_DN4241_c0_g1_i1.p1  ORF type:complete len:408 (+),score=110.58 TRINITY_DN4241_c0_g1_i1:41-1264(+)
MTDSYRRLKDEHVKELGVAGTGLAEEKLSPGSTEPGKLSTDDVIVPVAMTIVVKWIEDEGDGKLFLVGTLIQRVLSDMVDGFEVRVNEAAVPDGAIDFRRSRPVSFVGSPPPDLELSLVKGQARTYNIRLPLMVTELDCVSYPFKLIQAVLKFKFSTTAVDGVQYRPTILNPLDQTQLRQFYALKHHKKKKSKQSNPDDWGYNEEAFDRSASFDVISPVPQIRIPEQQKGKTIYFPKCDFQWFLVGSYSKALLSTVLPVVVLSVLQWFNWYLTLSQNEDTTSYLTNAITIILALVMVIPNMSDKSVQFKNDMTSVDFMILFFFIGTALSAYPSLNVALSGLIITTLSLTFPLYAAIKYVIVLRNLRQRAVPIKNCLPLPGEEIRGEQVNWDAIGLRVEPFDNWIDDY